MRLSDLVQASTRLSAERGRNAKVAIVAELLARLDPTEVRIGTAYIAGEIPQGRIGVGSDKSAADANTIDEVRALLPRDARG